jgi:predicted O-methyltransferase YrrM
MPQQKTRKELDGIDQVPGMLTVDEAAYLYRLGQLNPGTGVIVEIGSWKGKSTISLARGSIAVGGEKVYAIDPHRPLAEEGYLEDTEIEFRENIKKAGVEHQVVPMAMTSEQAVQGWNQPIRLLWIDGDHRYEQVKKDFLLWEPHVIAGGMIAMHDTIRKRGPKRVLWESVFRSSRFQEISLVDNIAAARKVKKTSISGQCLKCLVIGCRGLYIAARKLSLPYAKPVGRWMLKKLTT